MKTQTIPENVFTPDLTRHFSDGLYIVNTCSPGEFNNIMVHGSVIIELEKSMIPVRQAMEARGLNVDLAKLEVLIEATQGERDDIGKELRTILGVSPDVNFNSSRDVSMILQDKLGVNPRLTRTGRLSTQRRMLKDIDNPITDKIVAYRELEKLLSSLRAMFTATDAAKGKLHCVYIDTCPSGRLYTKDYSFQGIPELGRSVIYADAGCSFILFDYETFELRILSALAHDTYFKDCWAKGLDLHRKVVADMKGISYEAVTDNERKLGKALNFGLAYGQEPVGLARNLHTSIEQAQALMDTYKSKIPEIEAFKSEAIAKARAKGYAETFYGRKRFLPDITSPNISDRKKAERRVINHMIQGTGADIVKFDLVNLRNESFLIDTMLHDGILLTVQEDKVEQSIARVREIMEIEVEGMRFPVSHKAGKLWSDCY